jgi:predicted helicase
MIYGNIYIRDNPWYRSENVVKLGIATNAKDRTGPYITGEVIRGEYLIVVEIPLDKLTEVDKKLKIHFKKYNIYKGGGTEFYDRCILNLLVQYLKTLNIEYNVLSPTQIENMKRVLRNQQFENIDQTIKNKLFNIIRRFLDKQKNKPFPHQLEALNIMDIFYKLNDKGKLIWACGLGKALLSIFAVKRLNYKRVVIGVPSIYLQKQFINEILKIFPNKSNILFVGGIIHSDIQSTTQTEIIKSFLNNLNNEYKFVIVTYHSCYLLLDKQIQFDFKIGDEAHHLVGLEKETNKGFRLFHKIISNKSLFMTATEKIVESNPFINIEHKINKIYSMDNEYEFGKYIDVKSVYWAIEHNKITDYNIICLNNRENTIDEIICKLKINVNNKELFMACYMCLKSFETFNDLTHLLIYTNTIHDAEQSTIFINQILDTGVLSITKEHIYNNYLHSKSATNLETEINQFKTSPYGIISCVFIFGEGFDLPKLNGVCIAANMKSEIRIVQYILRPNRLESGNPDKKAYVIIPWCDIDGAKSYEKTRSIISQIRNVDENLEQKINVYCLINRTENTDDNDTQENNNTQTKPNLYDDFYFEENDYEMTKLKLRLKYSKDLCSNLSAEQNEYNLVRYINSSLHIKSMTEYNESPPNHSHFIPDPKDYFKSKGVWINSYDFMGVDTSKFIQTKKEWINFCKEKKIMSLDDYNKQCEIYDKLPKEPSKFYKMFSNIPTELGFKINKRR